MEFELIHELPREADHAWRLLFSAEYEAASQARSGLKRQILEDGVKDGKRFRRHRVTSDKPLPGAIAKVAGVTHLTYELQETFDDGAKRSRWKVIPEKLSDKVTAEGTYEVRPRSVHGTSERVIRGAVKVSIPLVGKKIEEIIGNEIRASYERSTEAARQWLSDHE